MYNIVVVKVSVVRISSFSLLRLASGYTLNWLPVTEKLKKLLQTQFGLDAICSGSGRYLLEDFFPSNMQESCVRENKKTNANCTQHKLHHTTKLSCLAPAAHHSVPSTAAPQPYFIRASCSMNICQKVPFFLISSKGHLPCCM